MYRLAFAHILGCWPDTLRHPDIAAPTFIILRLSEVRMTGITIYIAGTVVLAVDVYPVAAFSQLIVGRLDDKYPVKPILFVVAICQTVLVFVMAMQVDYLLFVATILAMPVVFGQITITDAVLSRYVPDARRAKALSVKFLLNLGVGAHDSRQCRRF